MISFKLKRLSNKAHIPTYGTAEAAGCDLYALVEQGEVKILPGDTVKIQTGICMSIKSGYCGLVFARSGLATKNGLRPANCVGVIDSDYRGEIIVALHNDSETTQIVNDGDRIAQIVFVPHLQVEFEDTDVLDDTDRGNGGFGSTGVSCAENNARN